MVPVRRPWLPPSLLALAALSSAALGQTPIKDIQDDIDTYDGQIVTIEGIVTVGFGLIRDDFTSIYVQDDSGRGINVFDFDAHAELVRGAEVRIRGTVEDYISGGNQYGTTEITDLIEIDVLSTGAQLPAAAMLTVAQVNDATWDGTLVNLGGMVTEDPYEAGGGWNIPYADDTGSTTLRAWNTTGLGSFIAGQVKRDKNLQALGIGSVYNDAFQVLVAYEEDLVLNDPPEVDILGPADGSVFDVGATIQLQGEATDPDDGELSGDDLTWSSNLSGQIGTGANLSWTDASTGSHTVTLTATDSQNASRSASISLQVIDPNNASPEVVITSPVAQTHFPADGSILLEGSATDEEDGQLSGASLVWSTAPDLETLPVVVGTGDTLELTNPQPGPLYITLTATDNSNAASETTVRVFVGLTKIASIQDSLEVYNGQQVRVFGVVTIGYGLIRDEFTSIYIQDDSGRGINIFDFDPHADLVRGTEVYIEGSVEDYVSAGNSFGVTEITDLSTTKVHHTDVELPQTQVLTVAEANEAKWDGTLVTVNGWVAETPSEAGGGWNIDISDGSGTTTLRAWNSTGLGSYIGENVVRDQLLEATGIGGVYNDAFQVLVAYEDDIVLAGTAPPGLEVEEVNEAKLRIPRPLFAPLAGEQVRLRWNAPPGSHVWIQVFDISGRSVATLHEAENRPPYGYRDIYWDGRDRLNQLLSAGTYIAHIRASQTEKVSLSNATAPIVIGARLD